MLNRLQGVFASLHRHNVKYVVIDGIAAVLHGVPRATFDLDILIKATLANAQRLLTAFLEAQIGTAGLTTAEELLAHEISIFRDWVQIDVQTRTPGIKFADVWEGRETMHYQGQDFYVVSRADLIASKRAAGRAKDLEDVRLLELDDASDGASEA